MEHWHVFFLGRSPHNHITMARHQTIFLVSANLTLKLHFPGWLPRWWICMYIQSSLFEFLAYFNNKYEWQSKPHRPNWKNISQIGNLPQNRVNIARSHMNIWIHKIGSWMPTARGKQKPFPRHSRAPHSNDMLENVMFLTMLWHHAFVTLSCIFSIVLPAKCDTLDTSISISKGTQYT